MFFKQLDDFEISNDAAGFVKGVKKIHDTMLSSGSGITHITDSEVTQFNFITGSIPPVIIAPTDKTKPSPPLYYKFTSKNTVTYITLRFIYYRGGSSTSYSSEIYTVISVSDKFTEVKPSIYSSETDKPTYNNATIKYEFLTSSQQYLHNTSTGNDSVNYGTRGFIYTDVDKDFICMGFGLGTTSRTVPYYINRSVLFAFIYGDSSGCTALVPYTTPTYDMFGTNTENKNINIVNVYGFNKNGKVVASTTKEVIVSNTSTSQFTPIQLVTHNGRIEFIDNMFFIICVLYQRVEYII